MATPLPEKINLKERSPDDLSPEDRTKYDVYYAEKARRKDPSRPGVAQEAIDCVAELMADDRSPSEAWTIYGYSLTHALKPAVEEEKRIVAELLIKPSKDVVENPAVPLKVVDVQAKYSIPEFKAAPEIIE